MDSTFRSTEAIITSLYRSDEKDTEMQSIHAFALTITCVLHFAPLAQTPLTTVRVADGLAKPLLVIAPGGDHDRLFIVSQLGRIELLKHGNLQTTPFIDLTAKVKVCRECGLLGLAFHPDYASNGRFYVNYTRIADGATIIEGYTRSANPDVADPNSGITILGPIAQPHDHHNGGGIAFGPDRYLYIGMGDGGSPCSAQTGSALLGKMLRIDVDSPTGIPPRNPYVNDPTIADEVWAFGTRNPWRFSFDRTTGDMYFGDVGFRDREEISFQPANSTGTENYGWPMLEGNMCTTINCPTAPLCTSTQLTAPILEYDHSGPNCCVIGGHVYRGCAIPDLDGTYFYADRCSSRIWSFRYSGGIMSAFTERTAELKPPNTTGFKSLCSFGEDADGEIYICEQATGRVYKIVPAVSGPARNLGFGSAGGSGLIPVFEVCGLLNAGNHATFSLRDAQAGSPCALAISDRNQPVQIPGIGTLVPNPILLSPSFLTDSKGKVEFNVPGGRGAVVLYAQWFVLDPGASGGVSSSNALEITLQ